MTGLRGSGVKMRARLALVAAFAVIAPAMVPTPAAAYASPSHTFRAPFPDTFAWNGVVLESPGDITQVPTPVGTNPYKTNPSSCPSPNSSGASICEDIQLSVPSGLSASTLYLKIAWRHPSWKAFLYATGPDGSTWGWVRPGTSPPNWTFFDALCDTTSYTKGCGGETNGLPFDELTIPNPKAGTWTVRVAAGTIHNESYRGLAALTNGSPLQYAKENLAQLTSHLTRSQRVNVVFVGWKPSPPELFQLKASLADQYQPSVAEKQFYDGDDGRDLPGEGLVQHETQHFTGTDPTNPNGVTDPTLQFVPYFEPVKFNLDYRFLAADDVYTRDLFATATAATAYDQEPGSTTIHGYLQTLPVSTKIAYLGKYNAAYGQYRGASHQVVDTTHVDLIDAFQVEDWIENTRFDPKYGRSFSDLDTGSVTGAQVINPDPTAVRDPRWNHNDTGPVNPDRNPQGTNQGITFLLIDTFFPSYADQYFRPDHYHWWASSSHILDPDSAEPDGFVDARGWGGRYRFYFQDLGAAPSAYERNQWARVLTDLDSATTGGSAGFDPPIWQYRNDPEWNGSVSPPPTAAGGSTLGQVMGWDIDQGLAFKYIGSYLYRPYPADVYVVAANSWVDHYSQPSTQAADSQDIYSVDMTKLYHPDIALAALRSAAPYVTFDPGTTQTTVLGCAPVHQQLVYSGQALLSQPLNSVGIVDPTCTSPDPRQVALETSKQTGTGELVTVGGLQFWDFAINPNPLRDFIDHNRDKYAPLYDGTFTIPVVNLMLEKTYAMALPALASGIAAPNPDGDGWGTINTRNDASVAKVAINCSASLAMAPGCNGVPDPFAHFAGLTYVAEHEAAHFLGLHHPHDGTASNEAGYGPSACSKASSCGDTNGDSSLDGRWHYYYSMLKWHFDYTASPTTYGHTYGVYEVVDQERLMYGHTAEYLKQAQDWLSDGYFTEGVQGRTTPSGALLARQAATIGYRNVATGLFQNGDYLHAQYAMKDAMLRAKGVTQAPVQPHLLTRQEAATDTGAVFALNPQPVCRPDSSVCRAASTAVNVPAAPQPLALPNTGGDGSRTSPIVLLSLMSSALVLGYLCLRTRRRV